MNMSDVKAITVPDYNYRELEYIHFSGAEYIDTKYVPTGYSGIKFKMKWLGRTGTGDDNDCLLGAYCNYLADTSRRLYWVYTAGSINKWRDVIGSTWTNTNLADNNIHWFGCQFTTDFKTVQWGMRTADWTAAEYSHTPTNTTAFTGWTSRFTLGSQGATGNDGVDTNRYSKIDVYEGYQHSSNGIFNANDIAINAIKHWIPCQRKSDNVCGLMDIMQGEFYPMIGTAITTAAAGPTVNEYINMPVKKIEDASNTLWEKELTYTIYNDEQHYLCAPKNKLCYTGIVFDNYPHKATSSLTTYLYIIFKLNTDGTTIYYNKLVGNSETAGVGIDLNHASSATGAIAVFVGNSTARVNIANSSASNSTTWYNNAKQYIALAYDTSSTFKYRLKKGSNSWTGYTTGVSYGTQTSTANLSLFKYSTSRTGAGMKIARVDYNNGTSISKCYPCKRSDGALGMYDMTLSKFYPLTTNSGQTDGSQYFWIEDESGNIMY